MTTPTVNSEPTLIEARDELRRMFLDADFISIKRTEFIDLHGTHTDVSFTVQVDNYGTSPAPTLREAMKYIEAYKEWQS